MEKNANEYNLPNRSDATIALESTIAILITIFAVVGNGLIIAAFRKNKVLQTIPNLLVVNLSIVDILASLTTHPLLASVMIQGAWRLGKEVCDYQAILNSFLFTTSHLSITLISLNRYFVIVHYKKYTKVFSKRLTLLYLTSIWMCSSLLSLSYLLTQAEMTFHGKEAVCVVLNKSAAPQSVITVVFGNITFLATVFFNSAIFKLVRSHRKQVSLSFHSSTFQDGSENLEGNRKAWKSSPPRKRSRQVMRNEDFYIARKILIVTSFYTLCWLPQGILKNTNLANVDFSRVIWMASTFCSHLSSVLNPILYGLLNRKLRKTILKMLRMNKHRVINIHTREAPSGKFKSTKKVFTVTQVLDWGVSLEDTLGSE